MMGIVNEDDGTDHLSGTNSKRYSFLQDNSNEINNSKELERLIQNYQLSDQEFPLLWYCVIGTLFVSVMGSLFHFAYQWTCCNWLMGLFVAVNESVFEHLKLLIFPLILFWGFDCLFFGNIREHLVGLTAAIYSGVLFLCVFYFAWKIIFIEDQLWFDILLFIVSALVSQITGWYFALDEFHRNQFSWIVVVPLFIVALLCYLCFTDFPPHIESIFGDPTGFYGRPVECKC